MDFGQLVIYLLGSLGRSERFLSPEIILFDGIHTQAGVSFAGESEREFRVRFQSLVKIIERGLNAFIVETAQSIASSNVKIVSGGVFGWSGLGADDFIGGEIYVQCGNEFAINLIFQCEEVRRDSIELLAPDPLVMQRVLQTHGDTYAVSGSLQRPLNQIVCTQGTRDLC